MLREHEEPEQNRVVVVGLAEPANHRGDFCARRRLVLRQPLQRRREVHIVTFEGLPHQFVFAFEVPVQRAL